MKTRKTQNASKTASKTSRAASASFWTPQIDNAIAALVAEHGEAKWTKIARLLETIFPKKKCFQGKKISERWRNHIRPGLKKGEWTEAEDQYIIQQQKEIGNKWSAIARGLENRNQHNVKNRWNFLTKQEQGDQQDTDTQETTQPAAA